MFLLYLLCQIATTLLPPSLHEISGIVYINGHYYAHNDSGDSATIYQMNSDGHIVDRYTLPGVTPLDIEDIAHHDRHLYLADTGRNGHNEPLMQVYIVNMDTWQYGRVGFYYPDYRSRNTETMFVDDGGNIYVIPKWTPAKLYRLDHHGNHVYAPELRYVGTLREPNGNNIRRVTTGADLHDGNLIVRGYHDVYVFTWPLLQARHHINLAFEIQGEGVSVTDEGFATVSEGDAYRGPVMHQYICEGVLTKLSGMR